MNVHDYRNILENNKRHEIIQNIDFDVTFMTCLGTFFTQCDVKPHQRRTHVRQFNV